MHCHTLTNGGGGVALDRRNKPIVYISFGSKSQLPGTQFARAAERKIS